MNVILQIEQKENSPGVIPGNFHRKLYAGTGDSLSLLLIHDITTAQALAGSIQLS